MEVCCVGIPLFKQAKALLHLFKFGKCPVSGSIVIKGVGLFLRFAPPAIPEADDGTEQLVFCSHQHSTQSRICLIRVINQ
jgi:hypothetical protein